MNMSDFFAKFEAFWKQLWEVLYTYSPWLQGTKH